MFFSITLIVILLGSIASIFVLKSEQKESQETGHSFDVNEFEIEEIKG